MGWSAYKPEHGPARLQHSGWLLTHNAMQTLIPATGYGIAVVANTGMSLEDDSALIAEGLVELSEGRTPAPSAPFTMTADPVLAVLTLLSLVLGVRGVIRARGWAGRRSGRRLWRGVLRLVPYGVPVVLFLTLPDLFGLLLNRRGTLEQVTYAWFALYVWLATAALASVAVVVARGFHLGFHLARTRRRPSGDAPPRTEFLLRATAGMASTRCE